MKLGPYELLREQGAVGAGTAWYAREGDGAAENAPLFAVTRVHKHLLKKPEMAEAFLAEVRPAIDFVDPHVAAIADARNEGELFVATALPEGEVLATLVTSAGAAGLPQPVALRIALDVLKGVAAAHAHDPALTHGELGLHQVIVGTDGMARVTGLTTARALSRIAPPLGPKNQERLAYAAPERVKAMGGVGGGAALPAPEPSADVFAAGVMLWELLAKQRLFFARIDASIVQKVTSSAIAALGSITGVSVPAALEAAVQQALDRDPVKRPSSMAGLIEAIEGLGAGAVAPASAVAAEVERLAGKAIAARRADLAKAAAKPAAAVPKPGEGVSAAIPQRKGTLLGIPSALKPASATSPGAPAAKIVPSPGLRQQATPIPESKSEPATTPSTKRTPVIGTPKTAATAPIVLEESASVATPSAVTAPASAAEPPPSTSPAAPPASTKAPPSVSPASSARAAPAKAPGPITLTEPPSSRTSPTPGSGEERSGSMRLLVSVGTDKVGPGSTLGRYEILMPVARGGMASVWAARLPGSRGFQKIFAIKTMLPDVSDDPDFENMFLDEGRVAARIRHPNVVEIIDLGEQDEVLYLVMEWVDGENLGALVRAARAVGGVPLPVVLKIASQIAAGLHAAHELRDDDGNLVDLVHRDVSPANVLVSSAGYVKIVDFGIAKSKGRLHQTRVGGVVKGKTPYLSPEQLGQLPIDRRSDIFSFGVLLYVLATGLHPFRGETDAKTIENIALRDAVPLRQLQPATPKEFEAVVLKALSKDPADRYATAAEMQRALDQAAVAMGAATTEEDVAAFVKQAMGDALTKRGQELRAAIDRAEGRAPSSADLEAAQKPAPAEGPASKPLAAEPAAKAQAEGSAADAPIVPQAVIALAGTDEPVKAEDKPAAPLATQAMSLPEVGPPSPPLAARPPPPASPRVDSAEELDLEAALAPSGSLPEIPPPPPLGVEPPRQASASDIATEAPLEVPGLPKRRRPVAMIAIGATLGVCALIGVLAIVSGGSKPAGTKDGTPPRAAATTPATPAPKPTPTPAPTPAPTLAAPAPTATAEPADTGAAAPADTGAPARPGAKSPPPTVRPRILPPPPKRPSKTYNPPGI